MVGVIVFIVVVIIGIVAFAFFHEDAKRKGETSNARDSAEVVRTGVLILIILSIYGMVALLGR